MQECHRVGRVDLTFEWRMATIKYVAPADHHPVSDGGVELGGNHIRADFPLDLDLSALIRDVCIREHPLRLDVRRDAQVPIVVDAGNLTDRTDRVVSGLS